MKLPAPPGNLKIPGATQSLTISVSPPEEGVKGSGWGAHMQIGGVDNVRLLAVHLHILEDAVVPTVGFVELFGEGLAYERREI